MLLAPVIAFVIAEAVIVTKRSSDAAVAGATAAFMTAGRPIQRLVASAREQVWLSPLVAALFTVYLVIRWRRDMKAAAAL
jgi:hypothetical protein